MSFKDFCSQFHITPKQREALVWHLASYRARKTVEALLPKSGSRP